MTLQNKPAATPGLGAESFEYFSRFPVLRERVISTVRHRSKFEITLTLTLSRSTGRGDRSAPKSNDSALHPVSFHCPGFFTEVALSYTALRGED